MTDNDPQSPMLRFPATARNRDAIATALAPHLAAAVGEGMPDRNPRVLEIASGSGEHLTHFASHFAQAHPNLRWQPSDIEAEHLASIAAWTEHLGLDKVVAPPLHLDVHPRPWPAAAVADLRMIFCANMIHIAPATATRALLQGAATHLPSGGALVLYGPFMRAGAHTAESNAAFDARLKSRDADWGVRELEEISREAEALGLRRVAVEQMPANNLLVVFHAGA